MAISNINMFKNVIGRGLVVPSHKDLNGWLKSIAGSAKTKKLKYSSEYLIISGSTLATPSIQEACDRINIPIKTIGIDNHTACLTRGPISSIFFAPKS